MDDMENEDIAAAMGFSSFGGTKKRKYDQTNSPKAKADASGANTTRLGVRSKVELEPDHHANLPHEELGPEAVDSVLLAQEPRTSKAKQNQTQSAATGLAAFLSRGKDLPERPVQQVQPSPSRPEEKSDSSVMTSFGGPAISQAELAALRAGVPDGNGDRAYFLPSFVKDPWEPLSRKPN